MDFGRNLLRKLKIPCHKICRVVQPYLDCDHDRCLNLVMIGGGIQPIPGTGTWKRICLILYRLLGFYQFIMAMAKVVFNILDKGDMVGLCSSLGIAVAIAAIYAKVCILKLYDEIVHQSEIIVNSNSKRIVGKVALVIFLVGICDQVFLFVPSSERDRLFSIPKQFDTLGITAGRLMKITFLCTIAFYWCNRYFYIALKILPLFMGLKHELMSVVRSCITLAEAQVLDDQNSVLKIKLSKKMLGNIVAQHVEVLRKLHLLKPLVSYVYAVTYYSVMFLVSLVVYLVIRTGLSFVSLLLVGTAGLFVIECYIWCLMVDSIQETMEMTAAYVAPLSIGLQHSVDNHSEYIKMRTSLMIMQLNASRSDLFNCGGIFPISVESFGNMCMIIYKLATFLLQFD